MAKKSKIAKNEQRKVIVARYATKRLELKKALVDPASTDAQREAARLGPPARSRRDRRSSARLPQAIRRFASSFPGYGAPRRIARNHQVKLVNSGSLQVTTSEEDSQWLTSH